MTNYPSGENRRGPQPKPSAIKQLHGAPVRNKNEPRPTKNWIKTPNSLSTEARKCWDEMVPELLRMGLLCPADEKLFAEFCEATVIVRLARIQVMRMMTGEVEPKAGAANPFNSYARAVAVLTNLGGRFGLTPADRTRIQVGEQQTNDDLISA